MDEEEAERAKGHHLLGQIKSTQSQTCASTESCDASVPPLPPHLGPEAGPELTVTGTSDVESVTPSVTASCDESVGNVPPHLRHRMPATPSKTADSGSVSTSTTVRGEKGQVLYNAWGPDGRHRALVKTPTATSTTDQGSTKDGTVSGGEPADARGQWQPVGENKSARGRSKWHKAPRLTLAEMRKQQEHGHLPSRHMDPDKSRLHRQDYCETDDSDY